MFTNFNIDKRGLMLMKLLPSIASAYQLRLQAEMDRIAGWASLHIDIEDGNFTPNITFGMKTLSAICEYSKDTLIDVHLMTTDPCFWLEQLAGKPIYSVSAHIEALPFPMLFINRAHALGMKAGLALNIKSSGAETEPFWELADYILVMTSEPDFAKEKLYDPALDKAIKLAANIPKNLELYADGGLTPEALKELNKAGAAGAVLGRLVFSTDDPLKKLIELSSM